MHLRRTQATLSTPHIGIHTPSQINTSEGFEPRRIAGPPCCPLSRRSHRWSGSTRWTQFSRHCCRTFKPTNRPMSNVSLKLEILKSFPNLSSVWSIRLMEFFPVCSNHRTLFTLMTSFWLNITSHVISFNELEWFVSALHSFSKICVLDSAIADSKHVKTWYFLSFHPHLRALFSLQSFLRKKFAVNGEWT